MNEEVHDGQGSRLRDMHGGDRVCASYDTISVRPTA